MNKLTIVLTLTSLTAALSATLCAAPSLADTGSLDTTLVAQSSAYGPALTLDEQNLFNAVNAARVANGLPPLALDPALIEPARYEIIDQVKTGAGGSIAFLADGATRVSAPTLAADFGANSAGVRDDAFDNFNFTTYDSVLFASLNVAQTDALGVALNWNGPATPRAPYNLLTDWLTYDPTIVRFTTSAAYTRVGVGTVRVGTQPSRFGAIPLIRWCVFAGSGPVTTIISSAPPPVVAPPVVAPPVVAPPVVAPPVVAPPVVAPPVVAPPVVAPPVVAPPVVAPPVVAPPVVAPPVVAPPVVAPPVVAPPVVAPPVVAPPSLYSILAGKYDRDVLSQALAAGPALTLDEQNLFNAVNAARVANGLPTLALDPALIEPARYEIMDQVKTGAGGSIAFLADGTTRVSAPTLAADFGANSAGVRDDAFDNFNFTTYDSVLFASLNVAQTDALGVALNWNGPATPRAPYNLLTDWLTYDPTIVRFTTSAAYTRVGVGTVRVGTQPSRFGAIPLIRWCVFAGF